MSAMAKLDNTDLAAKQATYLHQSMTKALKFGDMLARFPAMVEECIEDETWKLLYCRDKGRNFQSAREYFLHNEPDGVGITELRGFELLQAPAAKKALGLWHQIMTNEVGTNQYTEGSSNITTLRGTTRAYTLDRLSRESPGLYEAVCRGEMSANRAAIEAGFRKPPKPFDQIRKLLPKLTDAERRQLKDLL